MPCTHEIFEMDTAAHADGLCPLCLADDVVKMRAVLSLFVTWFKRNETDLRIVFDDREFYELQDIADAAKGYAQ